VIKKAKLFRNGRSQAVRLPKEFRLPGDAVYIRRRANALLLFPVEESWDTLIERTRHFTDDFMHERHQPPLQDRPELSG